jgi:DNA-binding LacI/PurR family transcriptional regulator
LHDEGIRVPDDVSVLGFDNISMAQYTVPRLSTIEQPINEIGKLTAQFIHQYITGDGNLVSGVILPHSLIIRESTAAINTVTSSIQGLSPKH